MLVPGICERKWPDHRRAERRHDILAAHIFADSGPAEVVALPASGNIDALLTFNWELCNRAVECCPNMIAKVLPLRPNVLTL